MGELDRKFAERTKFIREQRHSQTAAGIPPAAVVRTITFNLTTIEYEFWGERFWFSVPAMFLLSLVVGVIGGTYGIGGGAIIAPFCVAVFHLPVYTVSGAALLGTFLTSVVGIFSTASCPHRAACLPRPTGLWGSSSASAVSQACISARVSRNMFPRSSSSSCWGS